MRRSTAGKAAEIVALRQRLATSTPTGWTPARPALAGSFAAGGRLFTFGNGGSSTDAQAVAQLFLDPGPGARPLPAVALTTDVAVVTALSNDVGFDVVFARQLAAFARPGDVAVGLSTSGGSANVLAGLRRGAPAGWSPSASPATTAAGWPTRRAALDHLFVVPSSSVHRIQEAQTTTYHVLWELTQLACDARTGSGLRVRV